MGKYREELLKDLPIIAIDLVKIMIGKKSNPLLYELFLGIYLFF